MTRAIVVMGIALISYGFTWPPDYAEQSRADVVTCVRYARLISPTFDAQVRNVDLQTGRVDTTSSPGASRASTSSTSAATSVSAFSRAAFAPSGAPSSVARRALAAWAFSSSSSG